MLEAEEVGKVDMRLRLEDLQSAPLWAAPSLEVVEVAKAEDL